MTRTIAAVIPLYNGAKYIETSLRSVLQQTRPADEIIIVDDGSTDDGVEVAKAIAAEDARLLILSKTNGGQSSARNYGVSQSRSDFIAFLDQDDWWYAGHLAALERSLPDDVSRFGWAYSDLDEYDDRGKVVERHLLANMAMKIEHPKRTLLGCIGQDMYVLPSASLVNRKAFEAVGGFDERLSGYEDDDLFLRMFREGWANKFVRQPLSGWRIHTDSTSYSPRMTRSGMIYMEKLLTEFPDDPARSRFYRRDLIAPRFIHVALANYSLALREGGTALTVALRQLDMLRRHLRWRSKTKWALTLARPLMGLTWMGRMAARNKHRLRSLRRLLGV